MLGRLRLGPKLIGGFLFVSLLCAVVGYQGVSTMNEGERILRIIYEDHVIPLGQLKLISDKFAVDIVDACQKMRGGMMTWADGQAGIMQAREIIVDEWKKYLVHDLDDDERQLAEEIGALKKTAGVSLDRLTEIVRSQDREQLDDFIKNDLYRTIDPLTTRFSRLTDVTIRHIREKTDEAASDFRSGRRVLVIVASFSVLAALVLGFILKRNITNPAAAMAAAARDIALGDVNQKIEFRSVDEIGSLADSFRSMIDYIRKIAEAAESLRQGDLSVKIVPKSDKDLLSHNFAALIEHTAKVAAAADALSRGDLTVQVQPQSEKDTLGNAFSRMISSLRNMTSEILEAANILASSISEISAISSQLAAGASETATAVSETTTTVEEVKQTAHLASQKARHVAESAGKAVQISQAGKKATDQTVEGMNLIREQMESIAESIVKLSEQSQAIGEIISTVNDLADQSNLLAVNASIEAAKAGEEGKGFAVVAQEIRTLAEQSKLGTAQVRGILSDIQKATAAAVMATEQGSKAVEEGMRRSAQSGESIVLLGNGITEASQAATQIAASSQQQLVGMDQVALAMENIQQASVQNVESARQLETASHALNELGTKLKMLVSRYKV